MHAAVRGTMKRVAVVTGATGGLGRDAAEALARDGWHVVVTGRDTARGDETVRRIEAAGGSAAFVPGDLFTVSGARRLAADVLAQAPEIGLLVNNAGGAFSRDEKTADGLERTFALNVVAPFVLVDALRPALEAGRARIVNVVTGLMKGAAATVDELAGSGAKPGFTPYWKSKLALLAITIEQQKRLGSRGLTFVALHPGIIPDTNFGHESPAWFRAMGPFVARMFRLASTHDQAASRYVRVGTDDVEGGGYYYEGVLRAAPKGALDPAFVAPLWTRLETLARG